MLKYLSLDLRSLGLFRMGLGFLLLVDLVSRVLMVNDFYTDQGAIPRSALIAELSNPLHFSIFNIAGQNFYIYFLCLLAGLAYASLAIGYRTKLANFFSWFFFVSFSARAPILSHGGDDLIRLALFWLFFLPAESFFSVDRRREKTKPAPNYFHISSFAFLIQLVAMYICTALLKVHPRWLEEGSAIYYALELDQFLTSFGHLFRELAPLELLKFITRSTLIIEFIAPLLLLVPFYNSQLRKLAISTMILFHFGLFLTFDLGTFPWICMLYWVAMTPSDLWTKPRQEILEKLIGKIPRLPETPLALDLKFYNHKALQSLVALFLGIAVYWNLAMHDEKDSISLKGLPATIGSVFRLHQHWNMFAPYPILNDGWIVVEGNLMSGKVWDIFYDQAFSTEKPKKVSSMFENVQWRKYLYNLSSSEYSNHLLHFGRFLCRRWNAEHFDGETVDTFKVYYMLEKTMPPNTSSPVIERQMIWDHYCFSKKD